MAASLKYSLHQYAEENELQRLGVWEVDIRDTSKYWIIYIHGGAWRDPRIGHETFAPVIDRILSSSSSSASASSPGIAAFASLDYRLSPHPDFPQDPAETPARRLRTAAHPDHVNDVRAALAYLQRRYPESFLRGQYVLVGHSAGACLALQLVHGLGGGSGSGGSSGGGTTSSPNPDPDPDPNPNPDFSSYPGSELSPTPAPPVPLPQEDSDVAVTPARPVLPRAIVGFEGVYDFAGLNARAGGGYAGFLGGAFGADPSGWDAAAPMELPGSYGRRWGRGGTVAVVALGWSREDDLIDEPEIDGMAARLAADGVDARVFKDLRGGHDETWQRHGDGVARMVLAVLDAVREADADADAGVE